MFKLYITITILFLITSCSVKNIAQNSCESMCRNRGSMNKERQSQSTEIDKINNNQIQKTCIQSCENRYK